MQNLKKYLQKYSNAKSLVYILLLFVAYYLGDADLQKLASKKLNIDQTIISTPSKQGEYTVTRVVDGDTVHVVDASGKEEILRLLAVDTLEKNSTDNRERCLANMETKFTEENLFNKVVLLETDKTQGERDKYGRMLVYLKLSGSSETFNETLLKTGNARVYHANPPAINYQKYLGLQTEAQKNNLGMWNNNLCR